MRYTVQGRITQAGRREMEAGVYRYLLRQGVSASTISIKSVLYRTSMSGSSVVDSPQAASIVLLTDVDVNNKTVILTPDVSAPAPTEEELAAGAAALDAEISRMALLPLPENGTEPEDDVITAKGVTNNKLPKRLRRVSVVGCLG
jgi:hypothetical protein